MNGDRKRCGKEQKISFVFYRSWVDAIAPLDGETAKAVLLDIARYALDGTEPDFEEGNDTPSMLRRTLFGMARGILENDRKKYKETCDRNRKIAQEREVKKKNVLITSDKQFCECAIPQDDFFAVCESMATSSQYLNLSIGAKQFYVFCMVQAHSKIGRKCLFCHGQEEGTEYDPERYFVFPAAHLQRFRIARGNAARWFSELEQFGFIEKVEKNGHRQKVNVYRFSDGWEENV